MVPRRPAGDTAAPAGSGSSADGPAPGGPSATLGEAGGSVGSGAKSASVPGIPGAGPGDVTGTGAAPAGGPIRPDASAGSPTAAPPAWDAVPAGRPSAEAAAPGAAPPATPIYVSARVRNGIVLAVAAAAAALAWVAPGVLVVLLLSTLLAVLLAVPVRALQRSVPALPRGLAVLAALALVLLLLAAVLFLVVPALVADLAGALRATPSTDAELVQAGRQFVAPLAAGGRLPAETDAALGAFLGAALASALGAAESARASLSAVIAGVASAGFVAVSVVVIAVYLVGDAPRLRASFLAAAPPRYRDDAQELWETLVRSLTRMLVATLVSNTALAALAYAGLRLLGVPLAGVLAAVTWLASFVPIAGAWLGAVPAVLMALTVSPATALWTALLYVAVNFLDGNVLSPRLQGRALTVHPVLVLVAVLAAGQLFGLGGILVMLPLLAVVRVLAGFLARRLRLAHPARHRPGRIAGSGRTLRARTRPASRRLGRGPP